MRLRGIFAIACVLASAATMRAQTLETALALAEDGYIDQALSQLDSLVATEPKNHEALLLQGQLLWGVGQSDKACNLLEKARRLGSAGATLALADIAGRQYRTDDARALLETLKPKPKRGRRQAEPAVDTSEVEAFLDRVDDMLTRVEAVKLVDSVNVSADDFFRHYRLSPESGMLVAAESLPQGVSGADGSVAYVPQSRRQMIWVAPDTAGVNRLMWADALYGNQWEEPRLLGQALAPDDADAGYPFMMPDGITLYYAADGPESLGGYDIFMSRRTADGFLEPVNLGMPFNSPYNDFMMAVDEVAGIGWFASDRNRIPGQVTVYTYIPADIRVNVAADDPDLRAKALLLPAAAAKATASEVAEARKRLAAIGESSDGGSDAADFCIYIPRRGVLTRYSQLSNNLARQAAKNYVDALAAYRADCDRLASARKRYADGDTSRAGEISSLEQRVAQARGTLTQLLNQVVEAE